MAEFPSLLQHDKLLVRMPPIAVIHQELREALRFLTEHSLTNSAKWVGQLITGMTTTQDAAESFLIRTFVACNTNDYAEPLLPPFYAPVATSDPLWAKLALARSYAELREYQKCAHMLKPLLVSNHQSVIFYYYYSIWMSGLMRKEEELYENEGHKPAVHPHLAMLDRELGALYKTGNLSSINLYLYGLVLREQERIDEAKVFFFAALNEFPFLWSAWIELCRLIEPESFDILIEGFNDHWMKNLFFSSFCLEKYRYDMSIELNYGILCFFKNSSFIMNQIAHSFYNNQGNPGNRGIQFTKFL